MHAYQPMTNNQRLTYKTNFLTRHHGASTNNTITDSYIICIYDQSNFSFNIIFEFKPFSCSDLRNYDKWSLDG